MSFRNQEYILHIANCGGISRAAEQLHISQPALSKFLSKIEDEVGATLFIRTKNSFYPTEAGIIYLDTARKILRCRDEMLSQIAQLNKNEQELNLTISLQKIRAPRLSYYIHRAFKTVWPNCNITITSGTATELQGLFKHQESDIILINNTNMPSYLQTHLISEDQLLLAVSENIELPTCDDVDTATHNTGSTNSNQFPMVDLQNLQKHKFLLIPKTRSLRNVVDRMFMDAHITPEHIKEFPQIEASLNFAALGEGIAFTLESYIPLMQPLEPLRYYRIKQHPDELDFVAVCNSQKITKQLEPQIIDVLRKAFTESVK